MLTFFVCKNSALSSIYYIEICGRFVQRKSGWLVNDAVELTFKQRKWFAMTNDTPPCLILT